MGVAGVAEPALSSLASYRQTVAPETPEPDPCGGCPARVLFVMVNTVTGAVVPMRCARNACTYCLQVNARRRARAIALAVPERAILLTQVGSDFATVRPRMKLLRHRIAAEVGSVEWAWHVEPNPLGTGSHVHAWQHGAYVPQRLLSEAAHREGMGSFARINRVRSTAGASRYGLKGLGYGLKGVQADDAGAAYLRENGARLTHQSRGYFRAPGGQRVPVRVAERLASSTGQREVGSWVPMLRASVGATPGPA